MRLVNFVLLSFFITASFPANAFPWSSSENDKRICRTISSDIKNDFSARLTYKACIKDLKKAAKDKKEKIKEKLFNEKKLSKKKEKEKNIFNKEQRIFLRYCKKYVPESNRNTYGLISPELKVGDIRYKSFEGEPVYVKEGQIEKGKRNFRKWRYAEINNLKEEMKRKYKLSDFSLNQFEIYITELLPLPYKTVHIRECEKLFIELDKL